MYLTREQSEKILKDTFNKISSDYKEKLDFLSKLINDDDWSFVIKIHALIESLITEIIVSKLGAENLKTVIERMPLHGDNVSKIAIVKIYKIISPEQIRFIIKLSELRNNLVHKYENINFNFETYLYSLDKNNLANWKKMIIWPENEKSMNEKLTIITDKDPKMAIWLALANFISYSIIITNNLIAENRIKQDSEITTKDLLKDV